MKRGVVLVLFACLLLVAASCTSPESPTPPARTSAVPTAAASVPSSTAPTLPATGPPATRERLAGATVQQADSGTGALPECPDDRVPTLAARNRDFVPVAGPVELEVIGQIGGRPQAAVIADGRMYVGVGSRVTEFDLHPVLRERSSTEVLPGIVESVAVGDGLLVAALGASGLAVLELGSDEPRLASILALPGPALGSTVVGHTAFVAAGIGGLRIIDLAEPSRPRERGTALALHDVRAVTVDSGVAYLAVADEGLLTVDVIDLDAPRQLGDLYTGGFAFGVELAGSTAYLADGWGGLRAVDVRDPARPRLLGRLPTHGWAMDVAVRDGMGYVAASTQGLLMVDLADPAALELTGSAPLSGRHAAHVVVDANMAYVADPFEGLQLVDVRAPAAPEPVATWQPLLEAQDVSVADGRIYVAGGRSGMVVVDPSDPTRPGYVDALPTLVPVVMVEAVAGNVVFNSVNDPGSNLHLSLFWADAPGGALRAEPPFPSHAPMDSVSLGSIVVIADEEGVLIIDGSDPAPCRLAFYRTNFWPDAETFNYTRSIAVAGTIAYVTVEHEGIHVLDISEPRAPRLLTKVGRDDEASSQGLVVIGDRLYLLDGDTLSTFDLRDPARPMLASTLQLPAPPAGVWPRQLVVAGGRLFVGMGAAGLLAVDVSDPMRPQVAGRLLVPGGALSVASDGSRLFVGSDQVGLLIVEWSDHAGRSGPITREPGLAAGWNGMVAPVIRPNPTLAPLDEDVAVVTTGCLVSTVDEHGPGSLRDCLGRVRPGQAVRFEPSLFSPADPATIRVSENVSPPRGVTIDGAGGVILDGGGEVDQVFYLGEGAVSVRGLQIRGFAFAGLGIESDGNVIEGNVISGNGSSLNLTVAHGNRIIGNYLGVDPTGTRVVPSHAPVLFLDAGSNMNHIEGNLFGGDVNVNGGSNNTFIGNRLGLDAGGERLPCFCVLVVAALNRVGGSGAGEGNVLAGGLVLGGRENVVLGNRIGSAGEGEGGPGQLWVHQQANTIGGRLPGSANRVVGWQGIQLGPGATQNVLIGNAVGPDPGQRVGIRVRGSSNFLIANAVAGADEACVLVEAATANWLLANVLTACAEGVRILDSGDNAISGNTFIDNRVDASDHGGSRWDLEGHGNYWPEYTGSDADGDGIGDGPHAVPPDGVDHYPLMEPRDLSPGS